MRPEDDGAKSSSISSYPISRMQDTANKIMTNANSSLIQHEAAWNKMLLFIERFPSFMQDPVRAVLSTYEKRLRASYEWQQDFSKALSDSAAATNSTENALVNSFK